MSARFLDNAMIHIQLNGAPYVCGTASARISDLVHDLSLDGKRIAVERNGQIVPKSMHRETLLIDGDKIEVVAAIGGG